MKKEEEEVEEEGGKKYLTEVNCDLAAFNKKTIVSELPLFLQKILSSFFFPRDV